jgi:hypothetical protein
MQDRRLNFAAFFLISVYTGFIVLPSVLDISGIEVIPCNFRIFFSGACKISPFARRVSGANLICESVDMFRKSVTSLKQSLR